jgi:maltooligosyltrehalose trehalohydrolase
LVNTWSTPGGQQFVHFLQNHDQIANSARGLRLDRLGAPGTVRALTALLP